jgi:hypothetical protein
MPYTVVEFSIPERTIEFSRLRLERAIEQPKRARKPPRLDPVKSVLKMIAKNPALIARIRPDGEIEIAHRATTPASDSNNAIELDAGANDDVWQAIAAIKGDHGAH